MQALADEPTSRDPIDVAHERLGGDGGPLGAPVGPAEPTPDSFGRQRVYHNGCIVWSPVTGAHELHGEIREAWLRLGGARWGYPTTDETPTPDGAGRFNHFAHLRAVHANPTAETGEVEITQATRPSTALFGMGRGSPSRADAEANAQAVASAGSHPAAWPQPLPPASQVDDQRSIYWTISAGAHEVHGPIRAKWQQLGWEIGFGYPTTDQQQSRQDPGIWFNEFAFLDTQPPSADGAIVWTVADGAHEVHGQICRAWKQRDGVEGRLGNPTSDELGTPDQSGGRVSHFRGADPSCQLVDLLHPAEPEAADRRPHRRSQRLVRLHPQRR